MNKIENTEYIDSLVGRTMSPISLWMSVLLLLVWVYQLVPTFLLFKYFPYWSLGIQSFTNSDLGRGGKVTTTTTSLQAYIKYLSFKILIKYT